MQQDHHHREPPLAVTWRTKPDDPETVRWALMLGSAVVADEEFPVGYDEGNAVRHLLRQAVDSV